MKFSVLFFLLLLACFCLSLAQGTYENCCLKYVRRVRQKTKNKVEDYRKQETDGGCNIPAIVFIMKPKPFCADPNKPWVKQLMKRVDKKKASG
ncbi:C-C motif chemokine 25b [Conger conger]|nr:C-C motif chemokine 25b [Conger conger]